MCSSKRLETHQTSLPRIEIRGDPWSELSEPAKTVTTLAAITGMRALARLFGLKWEDLDFERRTIRIVLSLVDQIEGQAEDGDLTQALAYVE